MWLCIWSLIFRDEQRRRVFQNKMLRIFGPEMDEVMEECRKLYNERGAMLFMLLPKYNSNDQVEKDEVSESCSTNGEEHM
jgi:hypothetical protein